MAAAEMVAMADGVERRDGFDGTGNVCPRRARRRGAIVKLQTELVQRGGKKCHPSLIYRAMLERRDSRLPIDADGRLAGLFSPARRRWGRVDLKTRSDAGCRR